MTSTVTVRRTWNASRPAALVLILSMCAAIAGCSRPAGEQPQRLPKAAIGVAGRSLEVEVASSETQRQIGMMYRRKLAPDEGMLFVFKSAQPVSFYMKNTYVPLSIAFIADDGKIINIAHMEPLSLTTHPSRLPAMYALEMPYGWFANNGVKEGDKVEIPPSVTAAE